MTGDMVVNLYVQDVWRKDNKFNTRRIFPSDKERLLDFIKENFPNEKGWVMEADHAQYNGTCFISVIDNRIVGFACYDCTGRGYFGPFGVAISERGKGVGTELLYACFDAMKNTGYGYAIIGWVDDTASAFYEKAALATYIDFSSPENTLYKRRILTENIQGWDMLDVYRKWGDVYRNWGEEL